MEVMRYRVKLDMEDSGTLKTQLRLKQGDSAITLVFKILKNGVDVYSASDVPTVVFKRPDGTSVVGNMSVAEGQYTYTMAGNELQIAGPMTADVKFDVNTARESTCTFGFECVPDTMSPDTNPAGIFVNSLKDIINAVQQGVEKVEQAVEVFDVQQIIDLKNQIEELIEELPDFTIDSEFDTTSEHALQNKVIAEAIDTINDALDSLAAVATSGLYSDLEGLPTIPSALSELTSDATHRTVTDDQINTWNNPPQGEVSSVNGQTGAVVLDAGDLDVDMQETYSDGTVGSEIVALNTSLSTLDEFKVIHNGNSFPTSLGTISQSFQALSVVVTKRNKMLHFEGFFYSGDNPTTSNSTIITLNSAYRPQVAILFIGECSARFGTRFPCTLHFYTDGRVTVSFVGSVTNIGEIQIIADYYVG